MTGVELQLGIC